MGEKGALILKAVETPTHSAGICCQTLVGLANARLFHEARSAAVRAGGSLRR